METVKVSKKYQVVIPEKLRREANIKPGDEMTALAKHGILQYVPVRSLSKTKGAFKGLNAKIDSNGCIERFADGPKSIRYNRVIGQVESEDIVTPVVILYDVYRKTKKIRGRRMLWRLRPH